MAIQLAADTAPYGIVHCMKPGKRGIPRPPPPRRPPPIPWRPPSPWAVDSVTVRYTSTWRASPAATARQAANTARSCPGPSSPPSCQFSLSRKASCTSGLDGPREPAGADARTREGGQPVDVVTGEPGVGDGRQAGVQSEVELATPEPATHVGLADARDDRPAFEPLGRGSGADAVHGRDSAGLNSGNQMSSDCSKVTSTAMPTWTSSAAQSTRFVVSRTSSCSAMVTSPIT